MRRISDIDIRSYENVRKHVKFGKPIPIVLPQGQFR